MEFINAVLPNGLEVVAECNPQAVSAAFGFFVRTGARDEAAAESGVSHFLEHMAFKGRGDVRSDEINRRFDAMGATCNAYTSEESTGYFAAVLPEFQTAAVRLLADLLRPELRPDDFEMERQVILEEINMYEDQPPFGADDRLRAAFFGSHPLSHSVLGTRQSIAEMTREVMIDYHHRRYAPANVVLAAAGNVDFGRLIDEARAATADWEGPPAVVARQAPEHRTERLILHKPSAAMEYILRLSPAPPAGHPLRAAATVLAAVVGDEVGSRLFWELVDPGRAESAGVSAHEFFDAGFLAADLVCEPEDASENYAIFQRIFRSVQTEGVRTDEVNQARNKLLSRIALGQERPSQRLFAVAGDWIYDRRYRPMSAVLEEISAVTAETIGELLTLFPLTLSAAAAVGPLAQFPPEDG